MSTKAPLEIDYVTTCLRHFYYYAELKTIAKMEIRTTFLEALTVYEEFPTS